MVNLKVKRLRENSKLPTKAYDTDTGYDIYAAKVENDDKANRSYVLTGIAVQPDPGFYVEIFPRSSIYKYKAQLANSIGVIDESYRGEIILIFDWLPYSSILGNTLNFNTDIKIGDKIAQMVIRKRYDALIEEVQEFDQTLRGDKGFGSSGK